MRIEVINTGTELLLGDVLNTNLPEMAKKLEMLGLQISRQVCVPDGAVIKEALQEAFARCEIVIVTGGLGPTADDITRDAVAALLDVPMHEDASVVEAIKERLFRRARPCLPSLFCQAMVPEGAEVLPNNNGTAPGLYFSSTATHPHVFLLPGPPQELLPLWDDCVTPRLQRLCNCILIKTKRIYHIVGMGESTVETLVGNAIAKRGDIEVGYCARPNQVDLRLIGFAETLDSVEAQIFETLGKNIVSTKGENISQQLVEKLRSQQIAIATAESCTGGNIANSITDIPGASEIFHQGWVTYSNEAKTQNLGVSADLIATHGAVSERVARAMAEGALLRSQADLALAVTGIAGPSGGTPTKPIGTVFIALARRNAPTQVQHEIFATDRKSFKALATQTALALAYRSLL